MPSPEQRESFESETHSPVVHFPDVDMEQFAQTCGKTKTSSALPVFEVTSGSDNQSDRPIPKEPEPSETVARGDWVKQLADRSTSKNKTSAELEQEHGVVIQTIQNGDKTTYAAYKERPDGKFGLVAQGASTKELDDRLKEKNKTSAELEREHGVVIQIIQNGDKTTYAAYKQGPDGKFGLVAEGSSTKELDHALRNPPKR